MAGRGQKILFGLIIVMGLFFVGSVARAIDLCVCASETTEQVKAASAGIFEELKAKQQADPAFKIDEIKLESQALCLEGVTGGDKATILAECNKQLHSDSAYSAYTCEVEQKYASCEEMAIAHTKDLSAWAQVECSDKLVPYQKYSGDGVSELISPCDFLSVNFSYKNLKGTTVGTAGAATSTGAAASGFNFSFGANAKKIDQLGLGGSQRKIQVFIGVMIKIALQLLGSVALVVFVYAGVLWMTAGGKSDQQGKALKILLESALGIIIVL